MVLVGVKKAFENFFWDKLSQKLANLAIDDDFIEWKNGFYDMDDWSW